MTNSLPPVDSNNNNNESTATTATLTTIENISPEDDIEYGSFSHFACLMKHNFLEPFIDIRKVTMMEKSTQYQSKTRNRKIPHRIFNSLNKFQRIW